jgi:uncharacterized protein YggU (UPF0235/DUF167 family)
MIAVMSHARGVILPVRAKAGAKANELIDERDGALRVAVTAPPEGGRANEAIVRVLADSLNLRTSQITLLTGAGSRSKRFLVAGITAEDLVNRIEAALEPTLFESPDADV